MINFFRGKLEEGYWYLPPFLLVSKFTVKMAEEATREKALESILALHLRLHLTVLKFLTKDLHSFSKSVVDEASLEQYFLNVLRSLVVVHQINHESDKAELVELAMSATDEIIRVLYTFEPKHKESLVADAY